MTRAATLLALLVVASACKKKVQPVTYQAIPVEQRDIVVSAQAAGTVQPDTTVEVKSKASGEILDIPIETGQVVKRGQLLASVDPRVPRNTLAQAQADLEVVKARLANAMNQRRRADELFKTRSITEQEHEQALLDQANANAEVIRAQVSVDNARDQLDDTKVLAPIEGTILAKQVERGQVISSPTRDVGGGTVLLTMADLDLVQVRTLVDETDIGKIEPGQRATITVEAYPNRPFEGTVIKIEPQAVTEQNVTTFPVLVHIDNREGLLRPGMNAEVEIHIGQRQGVLAVPNAALRTARDAGSAAEVLGLSADAVQALVAQGPGRNGQRATPRDSTAVHDSSSAASTPNSAAAPVAAATSHSRGPGDSAARSGRPRNGGDSTIRSGRLRGPGDSTARAGRRRGMFRRQGGGAQGGGSTMTRASGTDGLFGGRYIVFVRRNGQTTPVWVRTGLTDLDYSEVISGLEQGDSVLILPSASLIQARQQQQEWINRRTQGAIPGAGTGGGGNTPRPR